MKLQGMFALAATPFDHTGAIYRTKVQHNFDKWRRTSLAGFIVGSHAGEGPLLDAAEKVEILKLAAPDPALGSTSILIADVSREGVDGAAAEARAMAEAGAAAVISRPPSEYRYISGGAQMESLYFRALADRSPVPVLIHNLPAITGVDLEPATIARLAEHPNIVGVLESGTPVERIRELRAITGRDFSILAGSEGQVWESLRAGANGAALAFASAAPYATIAIWEAFRTREEDAGVDWQGRIAHPGELVTEIYGAPGLKHAMDLNGYYGGPARLPFLPLSAEGKQAVEDAFRDLKG
ncbi:MAG TPA: dihydrodipicolinate synthase family protein [Bryobacteraceae bacterium]|nr:dihydrodipicolinate synthase family protein [Bryobacteraceae bacterium]